MSLRSVANYVLRYRGLELRERNAHALRYQAFLELLERSQYRAATVIDIGVNRGTPWLYGAFPDAKLVLIDANPDTAGALDELASRYRADVFNHALGAADGEAILNRDEVQPGSSSLLHVSRVLRNEWSATKHQRTSSPVRVPIRTLDATLAGREYATPFLIKIDTEGYEREVIRGATQTLKHTDLVVAEVSVVKRFDGSYSFAEFVALMEERRFDLYDILESKSLGRGGPLSYIDAAFVRRESKLSA